MIRKHKTMIHFCQKVERTILKQFYIYKKLKNFFFVDRKKTINLRSEQDERNSPGELKHIETKYLNSLLSFCKTQISSIVQTYQIYETILSTRSYLG